MPEDVAALVKRLRKQLDLTQEQFAQKVGVTYGTVNHWENGKRKPHPFLLNRLREIEESLDTVEPQNTEGEKGRRTKRGS